MSSAAMKEQKRVMLWATPRSLSTAMCRVMLNSGRTTEVLYEPYGDAYYLGPERVSTRFSDVAIDPEHTFSSIRRRLELPYADKELVFAKDMTYFLSPDHITAESLPDGYTHTFIIRHPRGVFTSLFKLFSQHLQAWWPHVPTHCHKTQLKMLQLVQQLGHKVVVIDADDLLENPEGNLRAYCREVGLQYCDSMINWEPMSEDDFKRIFCVVFEPEWHITMTTSNKLSRRSRQSTDHGDCDFVDESKRDAFEKAVSSNMAYYEEMYKTRLVAQTD